YRAKLVWLCRSGLDDARQRQVEAIEALGGELLYCSVDVSDADAVSRCVDEACLRFGAIHGLFHSALVLDDRPLDRVDEGSMRRVFAPKVAGTLALWRALERAPLDFF